MQYFKHHSASEWWTLIKRSVSAWSDDYAPSMGAALAYYSVFSMAPLFLLVTSIAGLVFGQEAARGELFSTLEGLMGREAAGTLQEMLAAMSKPSNGISGTAISIGALLIGATTVFGELQGALDRIWRAPERARASGIWGLLRSRFLSVGMILGIAFLLMVSLVATAALSALGKWWGGFFGQWELLLQIVNVLVGFVITAVGFALIYKFMPRVKVQWHDVWWGAAVTSLLFTVGKFLIGLYIGKTGVASGFGAAGSIAVVFVWVYYSAQIFLLGAEFTWIYAQMFGSRRAAIEAAAQPPVPVRTSDVAPSTLTDLPSSARGGVAVVAATLSQLRRAPSQHAGLKQASIEWGKVASWGLFMLGSVLVKQLLPKLLAKAFSRPR